jgi:glycosyltransferase involved in cell wall biosynthesis
VRVLIFALDGPFPRTNGLRLAVGALLEELQGRHDVRYVGYRMADQPAPRSGSAIRLIDPPRRPLRGTTLVRAMLRRRPWEADRLAAGLRNVLIEEVHAFKPNVVHIMYWALAGLGDSLSGVGSVLTAFDAWHLNVASMIERANPLRRPLIRAEVNHVRRFEASEFQHFGRVVVVSEQDKVALHELNPSLDISVIPNGVDTRFFEKVSVVRDPSRIVFTGTMNHPPNIGAARFLARRVFPRVRALEPNAQLVIVGRDPDPDVVALSALDGVEVTGEVSDIRPWLRGSRVFVCPMLSGTGIKNKLLEAMASELPCVATPLALQGLATRPGMHVLVGESEDELAGHILRVLADDALAQRLGRAAYEYVRATHSWRSVAESYESVYQQVQQSASVGVL